MIQEKTFRKDLFYRLSTLPLSIPPLCERKGDIPLLIHAIQRTLGSSFTLTDEAMEVFLNHPYPGNVRELYNYLEYLSCLGEGSIITYSALPVLLKKVGNSTDLTQAPMSLWIPLRKLPLFFVLPEYMPRNFSSSWANWLRLLRLCGEWGVDL